MAIDLLALEPQVISKNLRGKYIMLYGLPGIGKTSTAAEFEKVIIAGFEMGSNALHNVYVQPIKTWSDWKQMVSQLVKKEELREKFHSVAIDTVDEAWTLCVKHVCSQNGVSALGDIPWGGGYDLAKKEFSSTFRDLSYSGYGLIFTSHSTEKKLKNDKNEEYDYIQPALQKTPFDIVNKMVDIIGYIREVSVEEEGSVTQKRYLFLRDMQGSRFLAKSRYKYIKDRVELSYDGLVNAIYEAIDEEIKHKGGAASDAINPYVKLNFEELISEAKDLWSVVVEKHKEDAVQDILTKEFGSPIKFSEILPEQVDGLHKVLQEVRTLLEM